MRTTFKRYSETTEVESELLAHSGQQCEILRELTEVEADIADVGPMYKIVFADGLVADAFIDELEPEPMTAWIAIVDGWEKVKLYPHKDPATGDRCEQREVNA